MLVFIFGYKSYETYLIMHMKSLLFMEREYEVSIVYQPIIELKSNSILRYEALARFKDDKGNSVSTQLMIDLLELYREIDVLTDFVTDSILSVLSKKNSMVISFNLPVHCLHDLKFLDNLYSQCLFHSVSPGQVDIEISEKIPVKSLRDFSSFMHKAKMLGFRLSLDDFNGEYDDLSEIINHGFDAIKIDRGVISGVNTSRDNGVKLINLISLMLDGNIEVICEGVENNYELNFLRRFETIKIQGYILYRPLSLNQMLILEGM